MEKKLSIKPNLCIGCRTCELSCSFAHGNGNNLGISRIRVSPTSKDKFLPYMCLQCVEAACSKVCPTQAITFNMKTGALQIDENKCIKCRSCQIACPFGNIFVSERDQDVFKCDLCAGDPKCAAFCPTGALSYN